MVALQCRKPPLKQAQNKIAIEAAILNRILDRDELPTAGGH